MKKSKVFIGIGALVLTVGAFFTSKANKKFTNVTGKVSIGGVVLTANNFSYGNGSGQFNTNQGSGFVTVWLQTSSGIFKTLLRTTGNKTLFFKP